MQGFDEPQSADANQQEVSPTSVLVPAMARLGFPVLLFGIVFLLLVWVMTLLTSPDRFPVHTGDTIVRLQDLESRAQLLREQTIALGESRQRLKLEEKAPILTRIRSIRTLVVPLGDVLLSLEDVRRAYPITLPRIEYRVGTLLIAGEVRDPSSRSMQMLAQFVDDLRDIPSVVSVTEPEYVSHSSSDGGTFSPFILTLTLRRA